MGAVIPKMNSCPKLSFQLKRSNWEDRYVQEAQFNVRILLSVTEVSFNRGMFKYTFDNQQFELPVRVAESTTESTKSKPFEATMTNFQDSPSGPQGKQMREKMQVKSFAESIKNATNVDVDFVTV